MMPGSSETVVAIAQAAVAASSINTAKTAAPTSQDQAAPGEVSQPDEKKQRLIVSRPKRVSDSPAATAASKPVNNSLTEELNTNNS